MGISLISPVSASRRASSRCDVSATTSEKRAAEATPEMSSTARAETIRKIFGPNVSCFFLRPYEASESDGYPTSPLSLILCRKAAMSWRLTVSMPRKVWLPSFSSQPSETPVATSQRTSRKCGVSPSTSEK